MILLISITEIVDIIADIVDIITDVVDHYY